MKTVILIGTSHSIQRGENSPEQFQELIRNLYETTGFGGIAEEIDHGSVYIAERFCNENKLSYLRIEPDQEERTALGISSANQVVFQVINEFDIQYPEIHNWPSNPSHESLPGEVWQTYSELIESSYRAREAEWFRRLDSFNIWPVLCICGANHFNPFSKLLGVNGVQVTNLDSDWEPSAN